MDGLEVWLPCLQLLLGVVEDLAGVVGVGEGLAHIAGDDGCVVEVVEQAAAVFGKDDLFLCAFNGGGEVEVVSFFELLTGLTGQISLRLVWVECKYSQYWLAVPQQPSSEPLREQVPARA